MAQCTVYTGKCAGSSYIHILRTSVDVSYGRRADIDGQAQMNLTHVDLAHVDRIHKPQSSGQTVELRH